MYLLKLQIHKHGNSIYFMRDIMVCFPKFYYDSSGLNVSTIKESCMKMMSGYVASKWSSFRIEILQCSEERRL